MPLSAKADPLQDSVLIYTSAMRCHDAILFAVLGAAALGPALAEDWAVLPAPSDFAELEAASVADGLGRRLYLWPNHGGGRFAIVAELHLAPGEEFAAMPRYRIDGGDEVDTEAIRLAGEGESAMWGRAAGGVAFWRVWAGAEPVVAADDPFREWFTGESVRFAIATTAGPVAADFPLSGAGLAILAATRVAAP